MDYKKEDIIKRVKEFMEKNGRKPMKSEFNMKHNLPSPRTVRNYFGTTVELFRECGLDEPLTIKEITKEDVIRLIQEYHKKNGSLPKKADFIIKNQLPTIDQIKLYFKGIRDAENAAGFKVGEKKKIYTKIEVIEAIKNFYKEKERLPLKEEIKAENGFPSINKVRALFGTLRKAKEEAGFETTGKKSTENNGYEIKELLLNKYKENGRRLKASEIDADEDLPNYATTCNIMEAQSYDELWKKIGK